MLLYIWMFREQRVVELFHSECPVNASIWSPLSAVCDEETLCIAAADVVFTSTHSAERACVSCLFDCRSEKTRVVLVVQKGRLGYTRSCAWRISSVAVGVCYKYIICTSRLLYSSIVRLLLTNVARALVYATVSQSLRRSATRNGSVPIQLAQCRFPGLAISNAKMLIYFSNKIYGSSFIKHESETVVVWNYQNVDCNLRKKIIVPFIIISGALSFPTLPRV